MDAPDSRTDRRANRMIPADGRVAMLAIKENLLLRVVVNIVYFLPQRATRVEDALSPIIV